MKKIISFAVLTLFIASPALARKVTIVGEGLVKLVNPTAAVVTYTISCKDKTGASSIATTSDSLDPGKSKVYGVQTSASQCVSSHGGHNVTADTTGYLNGMVKCAKMAAMHVQVDQAAQLCNSGYRMCSLAEFAANKGSGTNLRGVVSAATFSTSTDSGVSWMDRSQAGNEYAYIHDSYSTNKCATGSNGGGTVVTGCENRINNSSVEQAYCCPDVFVDQCTVEINSNTSHLISPQFKGGTPF